MLERIATSRVERRIHRLIIYHVSLQLAMALLEIQSKYILHRDLKTDNVLMKMKITDEMNQALWQAIDQAKIDPALEPHLMAYCNQLWKKDERLCLLTDFGLSRDVTDATRSAYTMGPNARWTVGTSAPELEFNNYQSPMADIYSAGVLINWLCTQMGPPPAGNPFPRLPEYYGEALQKLVDQCLDWNPFKRPTPGVMVNTLWQLKMDESARLKRRLEYFSQQEAAAKKQKQAQQKYLRQCELYAAEQARKAEMQALAAQRDAAAAAQRAADFKRWEAMLAEERKKEELAARAPARGGNITAAQRAGWLGITNANQRFEAAAIAKQQLEAAKQQDRQRKALVAQAQAKANKSAKPLPVLPTSPDPVMPDPAHAMYMAGKEMHDEAFRLQVEKERRRRAKEDARRVEDAGRTPVPGHRRQDSLPASSSYDARRKENAGRTPVPGRVRMDSHDNNNSPVIPNSQPTARPLRKTTLLAQAQQQSYNSRPVIPPSPVETVRPFIPPSPVETVRPQRQTHHSKPVIPPSPIDTVRPQPQSYNSRPVIPPSPSDTVRPFIPPVPKEPQPLSHHHHNRDNNRPVIPPTQQQQSQVMPQPPVIPHRQKPDITQERTRMPPKHVAPAPVIPDITLERTRMPPNPPAGGGQPMMEYGVQQYSSTQQYQQQQQSQYQTQGYGTQQQQYVSQQQLRSIGIADAAEVERRTRQLERAAKKQREKEAGSGSIYR